MARLNGVELNKAAYGPGGYLSGQGTGNPVADAGAPKFDQSVAQQYPNNFSIASFTTSGVSPSKQIHLLIAAGPLNALFNVYVSDNGGAFSQEATNQGPIVVGQSLVYQSPTNKVTGHLYVYYLSTVINGIEGVAGPQFSCQE